MNYSKEFKDAILRSPLRINNHTRINAVFGVALMDVAMQAALAAFFTSAPRIPHWHSVTLL